MNRGRAEDPVHPQVTFDNYVIPETVRGTTRATPSGFRLNGIVVSVSLIAVLTFVLGVLVTLQFMGPGQPVQRAAAPTPQPAATALTEAEEVVTRTQPADLLSTAPAARKPEAEIPAFKEAVLKGLQPQRTVGKLTEEEMRQRALEAQAIVNRNKLRMLREGVLAGVYSVRAENDDGRKRLVLQTVNAEMTRASMGNLLLAAARNGEIEIPASLNTADGQIDMDTLLFNLIQTSLAEDGTLEGAEAAREMSRRAFAASDAKTKQVKGERIYTVEPGDSLAYISLQFYGRPNAYLRIFDANRDTLTSPDLIKIGQRLIIPG